MSRRSSTAWDVDALRWSAGAARDLVVMQSHGTLLHSAYGTRLFPPHLGEPCDFGLHTFLEEQEGGALHPPVRPREEGPAHSMALRADVLEPAADPYTQGSARARDVVVSGSIERTSPYWRRVLRGRRRKGAPRQLRGPMRARVPLVGADMRRMALLHERELAERTSKKMDTRRCMLPHTFQWTETDQRSLNEDSFGWMFSGRRGASDVHVALTTEPDIPSDTLMAALHYYVAQFYNTRGQLSRAPWSGVPVPHDIPVLVEEWVRAAFAGDGQTRGRGDSAPTAADVRAGEDLAGLGETRAKSFTDAHMDPVGNARAEPTGAATPRLSRYWARRER
ncbi:hypothetical protein MSPP1_000285 [Malassezia sp. CBS 17886]|nr:hypothetical protein MSPP1_000285 [Malassezia sp. CBS 17886]